MKHGEVCAWRAVVGGWVGREGGGSCGDNAEKSKSRASFLWSLELS